MKIITEHYNQLQASMDRLLDDNDARQIAENYQEQGLSPMRFRWSAFWACGLKPGRSTGTGSDWPVYDYANDNHIDTALRHYFKQIGMDWAAQH